MEKQPEILFSFFAGPRNEKYEIIFNHKKKGNIVLNVSLEDSSQNNSRDEDGVRKEQSRPRCRSDCMGNILNPENGKYFDFFFGKQCNFHNVT